MVISLRAWIVVVAMADDLQTSRTMSLLQHKAGLHKADPESTSSTPGGASTSSVQGYQVSNQKMFTMHGCECADNWHHDGLLLHGCVYTHRKSFDGHDLPWCFVKDAEACKMAYEKEKIPYSGQSPASGICSDDTSCHATDVEREGKWDFCTVPEDVSFHYSNSGCHCLPTWEHERTLYTGCAQPDAGGNSSSPWCYVAESDCKGAKAAADDKKQKWDDCDLHDKTPAFVTRHSCHCRPNWMNDGTKQSRCVAFDQLSPPAALVAMNASIEKESLYGWCHVWEDERHCSGAVKVDGIHMDVCFMVDEASVGQLETTVHGCHCLPEWGLDGAVYKGCSGKERLHEWEGASVGDDKDKDHDMSWCRVLEDVSVCGDSLGPEHATAGGAGRGPGRWDWCKPNGGDADELWRRAVNRFEPIEPNAPAWYDEFRVDQKNGQSDSDDQLISMDGFSIGK